MLGSAFQHCFLQAFEETYKREFGFVLEGRSIAVDDVRVRAMGKVRHPSSTTGRPPLQLGPLLQYKHQVSDTYTSFLL